MVVDAIFFAFGWFGLLQGYVALPNIFQMRVIEITGGSIYGFGATSFFFASLALAVILRGRKLLLCLIGIWEAFFLYWVSTT